MIIQSVCLANFTFFTVSIDVLQTSIFLDEIAFLLFVIPVVFFRTAMVVVEVEVGVIGCWGCTLNTFIIYFLDTIFMSWNSLLLESGVIDLGIVSNANFKITNEIISSCTFQTTSFCSWTIFNSFTTAFQSRNWQTVSSCDCEVWTTCNYINHSIHLKLGAYSIITFNIGLNSLHSKVHIRTTKTVPSGSITIRTRRAISISIISITAMNFDWFTRTSSREIGTNETTLIV